MKISKSRLKQIIKEELESVISEEDLEEELGKEVGTHDGKPVRQIGSKKPADTHPAYDTPQADRARRGKGKLTVQKEKKEVPVKPRTNESLLSEEDICEKIRTGSRPFKRAMKSLCDQWKLVHDAEPDVAGPPPEHCNCPDLQ